MDSELPSVRVAVALGSNLGDRLENLRFGAGRVGAFLTDRETSGVFETEPAHDLRQPCFLNACVTGRTRLTARQLLSELKDAERAAGREPDGLRWGPRPLDLDLLLYGSTVLRSRDLTIPHPRLRERAFVLVPLAEIAADWRVPGGEGHEAATVGELAAGLDRTGVRATELVL